MYFLLCSLRNTVLIADLSETVGSFLQTEDFYFPVWLPPLGVCLGVYPSFVEWFVHSSFFYCTMMLSLYWVTWLISRRGLYIHCYLTSSHGPFCVCWFSHYHESFPSWLTLPPVQLPQVHLSLLSHLLSYPSAPPSSFTLKSLTSVMDSVCN